jgi:hypothetical protein
MNILKHKVPPSIHKMLPLDSNYNKKFLAVLYAICKIRFTAPFANTYQDECRTSGCEVNLATSKWKPKRFQ